ncbi:alpha/beta hydrolase [Algoriphagus sp. C2-6-M1]|uniref:alpha/beta hydrolase n=1 Tax=Algoriphagus persicinus TaxID=3108754 RepID=UPI002B3C2587|nr:alpha/beta hydrolase [Algoriphagus sp. C2-6-M1]MEB2782352.1 alpha/beta hydrolase [Algoriphagus sp. C2-6-M1]
MKYLPLLILIVLILILSILDVSAQVEWLSTPESINQFREQVERIKPDSSKFDVDIYDKTIQLKGRQVDIRIYNSDVNTIKPGLIYVHGACWVAGSLNSHDEICRYLSKKTDVVVIAIDYRLAPENKYPSSHNDVYDASEWIFNHSKELGIDKNKFAISGESAGAYFAAATVLRAIDTEDSPEFRFQLLVYAALDGGGSSWTECKDLYFTSKEEVRSRYGSPLWSDNLTRIPLTFNIFGQYEISRAEEELYIRKLKENGVEVKSFMYKDNGHDVVNWGSVKSETDAHLKAIEYIKEGFGLK